MAIKKLDQDGKIVYEVFVKVRDSSGRQVGLRRSGITSEREAKKIEFELRSSLEDNKTKITWRKWTQHFLDRYKREYRKSTVLNYQHNLNKWMNPVWDDKFIDEITPSDVHSMIYERITGVSSYTKRGLVKIIKRVFNLAIEEGILIRNPAVGIRVKCADANQLVLNKNEIAVLLKEAKSVQHRFYNHWVLAILTGMRSGELYSLRWTDVELVSGIINIS